MFIIKYDQLQSHYGNLIYKYHPCQISQISFNKQSDSNNCNLARLLPDVTPRRMQFTHDTEVSKSRLSAVVSYNNGFAHIVI